MITIGTIKGKVRVARIKGRAALMVMEPVVSLTDDQIDELIRLLHQARTVTRR